jgi:hypothetical protein
MTGNALYIDTKEYKAQIDRFIDQMKKSCDKDKYKTITTYMFTASEPMEKMAKALVQNTKNKVHFYKTKGGNVYKFTPGTLKRSIKRRKLGMNKGQGNPAIRITSFSKNKAQSAYYGGMVNVGHIAGKKRVYIAGQGFYEAAREANTEQFKNTFETLMIKHIQQSVK